MSLFAKYLLFIEKTKYRKTFYLSPFIILALAWVPIIFCKYVLNIVIVWPILLGTAYFLIWFVFMWLRFYFTVGTDGKVKRRQFIKLSQVFNDLRKQARKYGWVIKESTKPPLADFGFTLDGVEDGVNFKIEIVNSPVASSNASAYGALPSSGIYIKTKKGEDFEVSWEDNLENIEAKGAKAKFIELGRSDLLWLIKENQYVQVVSFKNASMGVLINPYLIANNIKEIISRLVHIAQLYNQVS